jgi:predicted SAM-dependent methyltransferase
VIISKLKKASRLSIYKLYKDKQLTKAKRKTRAAVENYTNSNTVTKLHIGAGGSFLEGWFNIDLEPLEERIYFMDASTNFPMNDRSFNYIFSEHLIEHLDLQGQIRMLQECLRILKPGGKIRIATPDLDFLMSVYKNQSADMQEYIDWAAETYLKEHIPFLGNSVKTDVFIINNYFHSWGHQFLHNKNSLYGLLEKTGFRNICTTAIHSSSDPNLQRLERHGEVITPKYNEWETMVFEAEKV